MKNETSKQWKIKSYRAVSIPNLQYDQSTVSELHHYTPHALHRESFSAVEVNEPEIGMSQ